LDSSGNAFVTGTTGSTDFPILSEFQATYGGGKFDVFVSKLNSSGSGLLYSTYLGGEEDDRGHAIALDGSENAFVIGESSGSNFPLQSTFQATHGGHIDVIVFALDSTGSDLLFFTYLGGSSQDIGNAISVDTSGNVFIAGGTRSTEMPTQSSRQSTLAGGNDVYLAKMTFPIFKIASDSLHFLDPSFPDQANTLMARLTNRGGTVLNITGIVSPDIVFQFSPAPPFQVQAGDSVEVEVTLSTLPAGDLETSLVFQSDDPFSVQDTLRVRIDVAETGEIFTVAGNGGGAFEEGKFARDTGLSPNGILVDSSGNLYIADDAQVLRVDGSSGVVSVVAGNGIAGNSGDGGPATGAQLGATLSDLFMDGAGNLYISDSSNHQIRKVDPSGTITKIAGYGSPDYFGDGGQAFLAGLNAPLSVFVRGGNVYIADSGNGRIRKIDTEGNITTVAGGGSSPIADLGEQATSVLLSPTDIFVDERGNIFVSDGPQHVILKVDPFGVLSVVAGSVGSNGFSGDGGPAVRALLDGPVGIFVDAEGAIFIADRENARVRKVDTLGRIFTVAGSGSTVFSGEAGPATEAGMVPARVFVDDEGALYISDLTNLRVDRVAGAAAPTQLPHSSQSPAWRPACPMAASSLSSQAKQVWIPWPSP
jgi:sugar lactone lactonase YvrE